jgi:hypothetical protein
MSVMSNSGHYPQIYEVAGAGSTQANGKYVFAGLFNDHPYYVKERGSEAIWLLDLFAQNRVQIPLIPCLQVFYHAFASSEQL